MERRQITVLFLCILAIVRGGGVMAWPQDSAAASTLVDKKPPPKPTPETSTSTPAENFASSITGCQNTEQWDYDDGKCVPEDVNITAYQCLRTKLEVQGSLICFDETVNMLSKSVEAFIDASSTRGDAANNFRLSMKDVHLFMRDNYATLIKDVGQNIFPLIVATDSDGPDLSGTGGAYKVYYRNGTMRRIVPVGTTFEIQKCLSHMILGVYTVVAPYFRVYPKNSTSWIPKLSQMSTLVDSATLALEDSGLPPAEYANAKSMLNTVSSYIATTIKNKRVDYKAYQKFANEMAPKIQISMDWAAAAHVNATIPALIQLKKEMGDELWRKTYVIIPTVWPVALYNLRLQMFAQVMDFKQLNEQVLIAEGAKDETDARTTLGRIVNDRALAQLVFGGTKGGENMKDHLFSLSTKRDLVSTADQNAIDRWCNDRDKTAPPSEPRCPFSKTLTSMLKK